MEKSSEQAVATERQRRRRRKKEKENDQNIFMRKMRHFKFYFSNTSRKAWKVLRVPISKESLEFLPLPFICFKKEREREREREKERKRKKMNNNNSNHIKSFFQ